MNVSAWLVDTIHIARPVGLGADGGRVYADAVAIQARQENTQKIVRSKTGAELQASHVLATDTEIAWGDLVWLTSEVPATDEPHRIIGLKSACDKHGHNRLFEVYL